MDVGGARLAEDPNACAKSSAKLLFKINNSGQFIRKKSLFTDVFGAPSPHIDKNMFFLKYRNVEPKWRPKYYKFNFVFE